MNVLEEARAEFDKRAGRSLALPLAGAVVWAAIAVVGALVSPRTSTFVLVIGTGVIFPLGLLLARALGERLFTNTSPLAKLMAMCVLMVNLLWAVHITLLFTAPSLISLTVAISLGLHWIVFSWIINHPVGVIHAIARTLLVTAAWWYAPDHRVTAVAVAVVVSYLYSLLALRRRPLNRLRPQHVSGE